MGKSKIYTEFLFVLRKAAPVNHYISSMSPHYHYLLFLSTMYNSLTSWVYHRDQYLFPEGGWEFFTLQLKGVVYHSLFKTVFFKQGTGADKDECQSPVQIPAHGSWSLWIGCWRIQGRHQSAFSGTIPSVSAVAFWNTNVWIKLFIFLLHFQ